jgi:hypothetical protein
MVTGPVGKAWVGVGVRVGVGVSVNGGEGAGVSVKGTHGRRAVYPNEKFLILMEVCHQADSKNCKHIYVIDEEKP